MSKSVQRDRTFQNMLALIIGIITMLSVFFVMDSMWIGEKYSRFSGATVFLYVEYFSEKVIRLGETLSDISAIYWVYATMALSLVIFLIGLFTVLKAKRRLAKPERYEKGMTGSCFVCWFATAAYAILGVLSSGGILSFEWHCVLPVGVILSIVLLYMLNEVYGGKARTKEKLTKKQYFFSLLLGLISMAIMFIPMIDHDGVWEMAGMSHYLNQFPPLFIIFDCILVIVSWVMLTAKPVREFVATVLCLLDLGFLIPACVFILVASRGEIITIVATMAVLLMGIVCFFLYLANIPKKTLKERQEVVVEVPTITFHYKLGK